MKIQESPNTRLSAFSISAITALYGSHSASLQDRDRVKILILVPSLSRPLLPCGHSASLQDRDRVKILILVPSLSRPLLPCGHSASLQGRDWVKIQVIE